MGLPILAADQRLSQQNSITERSGIAFLGRIDGKQDKQSEEERNVVKAMVLKGHKGGSLSQAGQGDINLLNASVLPSWARKVW